MKRYEVGCVFVALGALILFQHSLKWYDIGYGAMMGFYGTIICVWYLIKGGE